MTCIIDNSPQHPRLIEPWWKHDDGRWCRMLKNTTVIISPIVVNEMRSYGVERYLPVICWLNPVCVPFRLSQNWGMQIAAREKIVVHQFASRSKKKAVVQFASAEKRCKFPFKLKTYRRVCSLTRTILSIYKKCVINRLCLNECE